MPKRSTSFQQGSDSKSSQLDTREPNRYNVFAALNEDDGDNNSDNGENDLDNNSDNDSNNDSESNTETKRKSSVDKKLPAVNKDVNGSTKNNSSKDSDCDDGFEVATYKGKKEKNKPFPIPSLSQQKKLTTGRSQQTKAQTGQKSSITISTKTKDSVNPKSSIAGVRKSNQMKTVTKKVQTSSNEKLDKLDKLNKLAKTESSQDMPLNKVSSPNTLAKSISADSVIEMDMLPEVDDPIDEADPLEQETKNTINSSNNLPNELSSENPKKGLYVPPSASSIDSDWNQVPGRRKKEKHDKYDRNGKYDRNNRNDPIVDDTDAATFDYYNPAIKLPGDDMKLNSQWTVWIHENDNQDWDLASYESIYHINSIGSMWRFLSVFDNLNKNVRQYYIMRDGITPIWEDNNNKNGAICSIMIDNTTRGGKNGRCDLGVDAFTALCILVLNESFVKDNNDINGLCYSIKSKSVLNKLWVRDFKKNEKFGTKLPYTFLKALENLIINMVDRGYQRPNNKSLISVQTRAIEPNY
jgi:hypothetical protein